MPEIKVLEFCILCMLCIKTCPVNILEAQKQNQVTNLSILDKTKCLECRACEKICPKNAIIVDPF